MQAAAKCMSRLYKEREGDSNECAGTLQEVRDAVFLYVYAPVLMEYVEWVLSEARREGKKRLYFLARDGYMMYLAAQRLAEERNADIEIRYLKISRLAVRNAADHHAIAYFRQEGLLENVPYALVDSGWVGSLQLGLQRMLTVAGGRPIRLQGYYFGLYARPKGTSADQYRHFYFGERNIRRKIRFSNCLLEAVCSSPAGMVCGYRPVSQTEAAGYEAVESRGGNPNAEIMERFAGLFAAYAGVYLEEEHNGWKRKRTHRASVCMVGSLLKPMMGNPTAVEAEAFGRLLFSDNVWETFLQPVAAVWKEEELRRHNICSRLPIRMGIRKGVLPKSAWMEGSIVRLGIDVHGHILQERFYKGLMYLRKAVCQ